MRIGIISDIHANSVALEKVLQVMGPVDSLWCLGDVVGYGPNPNESVEILLEQPNLAVCLTGNHDWAVLGKLDLTEFNPDARQAALWTRDQLKASNLEFLRERPGKVVQDAEFTLAHASPRQPIWEYITSASLARANFVHFETPYCLVGHTHVPAIFALNDDGSVHDELPTHDSHLHLRDGRRYIVNPGSVGQPRDSDPRAAYAILDTAEGALHFYRTEYDIAETQKRMTAAQLPDRLVKRLNFGW